MRHSEIGKVIGTHFQNMEHTTKHVRGFSLINTAIPVSLLAGIYTAMTHSHYLLNLIGYDAINDSPTSL